MVSASSFIELMARMPSQLVPTATSESSVMTASILVIILTRASNDIFESPFPTPRLQSFENARCATTSS
jgi:hypothetical protein